MTDNARILVFVLNLVLICYIIYITKKRKLLIKYSIFWTVIVSVVTVFIVNIDMADKISSYLKIDHSPSFYFFVSIIFLLVISMYFTVELSRMSTELKNLIQEISILKCNKISKRNGKNKKV